MSASYAEVSGRGVVSSSGLSVDDFSSSVLGGRSSIAALDEFHLPGLRFAKGAPVRNFNPSEHFDERTLGGIDRFTQFAAVAARQAWKEAGFVQQPPPPERIGVVFGTANAGLTILESGWRRLFAEGKRPVPLTIPMAMGNAPASRIAREIGAKGPVFATTSACASASHALYSGLMLIRMGLADVVVAGGADACFAEGYRRAWDA